MSRHQSVYNFIMCLDDIWNINIHYVALKCRSELVYALFSLLSLITICLRKIIRNFHFQYDNKFPIPQFVPLKLLLFWCWCRFRLQKFFPCDFKTRFRWYFLRIFVIFYKRMEHSYPIFLCFGKKSDLKQHYFYFTRKNFEIGLEIF